MPAAVTTCWIDQNNSGILANCAAGVFDNPIDATLLFGYLGNPNNWFGVAIADGEVVGQIMAVVHQHPDQATEVYLDEIGTADAWRRKGVANRLMKMLYARTDEAGIEEIWVGTEMDNLPARALYERTGAVGEESIFYYLEWSG